MSAPSFAYVAVDRSGARCEGVVSAATRQDAYRKVASGGLTPTKLKEVRDRGGVARPGRTLAGRGRRVGSRDVAQFTHQLAVLLEARIPIADGIRSIAEQERNDRFRRVLLDIAAGIQSGASVTAAMGEHRRIFGDLYIETMRAAEKTGAMIEVLGSLAEMLERQDESGRHLRQAMTYPALVLVALGTALLFLLAFVVPRFATMFAERGVELPALTMALQALGVSLRGYWWAFGAGAAAVGFGVHKLWSIPAGRAAIDRALHRTPYLRTVLTGLAVGRFARVLGISLGAGLGLIESIEMSGRSSGRPMLMDDARTMVEQVRQGGRLGDTLRGCRYMPAFATQMMSAGEESGELPRMCGVVARHYERETSHLIRNAATVIEPLLIAVLTGAVMVVALSIFLPMWDMVNLVN